MKILKQYNIPRLGALVDSLYTSLPILSILNFLSILTVLYTSVKDNLLEYVPWINFWMFIGALGVLTMSTMIIIYKFVLPSVWTFRQKQMFQYESDLLKEIRGLKEKVEELLDGKKE